MAGDERLRLFVAFPLPDNVRESLRGWQERAFVGLEGVRVVPLENLHVTVAFLGSRPASEADAIIGELREEAGRAERPVFTPLRYRETRSVGMVVFDDEEGRAAALAESLFGRLERLGVYERERRPWLAHVTVLRFRRAPRLRLDPPELEPVSPSEVALYTSVLRRTGAQYEIRESVALGG